MDWPRFKDRQAMSDILPENSSLSEMTPAKAVVLPVFDAALMAERTIRRIATVRISPADVWDCQAACLVWEHAHVHRIHARD